MHAGYRIQSTQNTGYKARRIQDTIDTGFRIQGTQDTGYNASRI